MILTDDMLAVAFQYRETELWKELTDSDIFAFRLSDGEVGYCCVMGNGGEHWALGFYRGEKGFTSYLKTIDMGNLVSSSLELFELASTLDCINCDFMQAADMDSGTKKIIRRYADAHGVKIRRSKGWPDFTRYLPDKMQGSIYCEKDANDIVEALRAAIAVAKKLESCRPFDLGFDKWGSYPTKKGGKKVPYLIPNVDGVYDWSLTELPAYQPDEWPMLKFDNDILANAVKKLPAIGRLQMKQVLLPALMGGKCDEPEAFPSMLLCMHAADGNVFPILSVEEAENQGRSFLMELANGLRESGNKPEAIEVADARTESLLADFCKRCGIRLSRKKKLAQLEEACAFMISNYMGLGMF